MKHVFIKIEMEEASKTYGWSIVLAKSQSVGTLHYLTIAGVRHEEAVSLHTKWNWY